MSTSPGRVDWRGLLRSWDAQQEAYEPAREMRFQLMFDAVQASVRQRFTALDLGAGPGSLSQRFLQRFPSAKIVAVDYDPVTLRVGQEALGNCGGRLTWVDTHLGRPGWSRSLPRGPYRAALSTAALHWLTAPQLRSFYRELSRVLPRGAVFVNGDCMPWGPGRPVLARLCDRAGTIDRKRGSPDRGWKMWKDWWGRAERIPQLGDQFREHHRRLARHPARPATSLETHVRALHAAGFREVETIWQRLEDRVLFSLH